MGRVAMAVQLVCEYAACSPLFTPPLCLRKEVLATAPLIHVLPQQTPR